jgi:hypothetical protein
MHSSYRLVATSPICSFLHKWIALIALSDSNAATAEHTQTEEALARLRGPIGIYIGSKMPSEIAVSVMTEILAVRNRVALPRATDVGCLTNARQTCTQAL